MKKAITFFLFIWVNFVVNAQTDSSKIINFFEPGKYSTGLNVYYYPHQHTIYYSVSGYVENRFSNRWAFRMGLGYSEAVIKNEIYTNDEAFGFYIPAWFKYSLMNPKRGFQFYTLMGLSLSVKKTDNWHPKNGQTWSSYKKWLGEVAPTLGFGFRIRPYKRFYLNTEAALGYPIFNPNTYPTPVPLFSAGIGYEFRK